MKKLTMALCMVTFLGLITTSFAERFSSEGGYFWADTPIGRLECHEEDGLQVVKIGGKEEYRKPDPFGPNSDRKGGSILPYGIQGGIGCPKFIANESGYVVYEYEYCNCQKEKTHCIDYVVMMFLECECFRSPAPFQHLAIKCLFAFWF